MGAAPRFTIVPRRRNAYVMRKGFFVNLKMVDLRFCDPLNKYPCDQYFGSGEGNWKSDIHFFHGVGEMHIQFIFLENRATGEGVPLHLALRRS